MAGLAGLLRPSLGRGRIPVGMPGRTRRGKLGIALLAALVAVSAWWWLHPRPSNEKLILALVSKAEHGVETKNRQEIMDCVAQDYHDEEGLTRLDIFRLALHWERSSEQVGITVNEYQLDITPPTATGRFEVELAFSQTGESGLPGRLPLVVKFEKQRRGWRKLWLVKSVGGHGLGRNFEELL